MTWLTPSERAPLHSQNWSPNPRPHPITQPTLGKMTTWLTPSERASATWSTTFLP
jgi:hypothetical protein